MANFDPDRILLFDSRARGEAREGSDDDFLMIADSDEPRGPRTVSVYRTLGRIEGPYEIFWGTAEEVEDWRELRNHCLHAARRDGIVCYEKDRQPDDRRVASLP